MDVFSLRDRLIESYRTYTQSFVAIQDVSIRATLDKAIEQGAFWPEPLLQLNPAFEEGGTIDECVARGELHLECSRIFRAGKSDRDPLGKVLALHRHQAEAMAAANARANYVLTTGTGSGKSLAYIIPIVDHVLRRGSGRGVQAVVVYPMNALANSQEGELEKFLAPVAGAQKKVTFARFTGQETDEEKDKIRNSPPDILLTNYVMLELLLTRPEDRRIVERAKGLRYLVFDELHTYRGRQGADVAMLIRRTRERLEAHELQCVGTSATLASEGTLAGQQREIARVASQIFGVAIEARHVIGESLRRSTAPADPQDPGFVSRLRASVQQPPKHNTHADLMADPLASWIEATFGVELKEGRLVRVTPRAIGGPQGGALTLAKLIGVDVRLCERAIRDFLTSSYQPKFLNAQTGRAPFAFRLHQFLSPGSSLYATLEPELDRDVTVRGQRFSPAKGESHMLFPLVFCRECGQEYYCVTRHEDGRQSRFEPRSLAARADGEDEEAGYLFLSTANPWPEDPEQALDRVPPEWTEQRRGRTAILQGRKKDLPQPMRVAANGLVASGGERVCFIHAPFRLCLSCGVSYSTKLQSDYGKLSTLIADGRSTATTLLSLLTVLELREQDLKLEAKKLLSFTDNRQDAALQAGHFNDFVQVGLIRGALVRALEKAGTEGLRYDRLPRAVFDTLGLPFSEYATDPNLILRAQEETKQALADILEYRLYYDLKQGWRVTAPNLEQVGLLRVEYLDLEALCSASEYWKESASDLAEADSETRFRIANTLLHHLRQALAIKASVLTPGEQDGLKSRSYQKLLPPWALDENENLEQASFAVLRGSPEREGQQVQPITPLSAFGIFLRQAGRFPNRGKQRISTEECEAVIASLFQILTRAGLLERIMKIGDSDAFQIPAAALLWKLGDGKHAFHDPLRMPRAPSGGRQANQFFSHHYLTRALATKGIEAREHTAQVQNEDREDREQRFRAAKLSILYCSPTMELGVDIAELNVVHMRNVPPTPANYAQRSGRAGRSGQPALVMTYCAAGSSHDRYFFDHEELMVAGKVSPPRLDLANEDLLRAHVHAIWLAETHASLGTSLADVLDLTDSDLPLLPSTRASLEEPRARLGAARRAALVLASLEPELSGVPWFTSTWLEEQLNQAATSFSAACERWRGLFRSAQAQMNDQHKVMLDASRNADEKRRAERLYREAKSQLDLLSESRQVLQADFYSYRYFASEGFLPGYNFPRLPLSAFIPARRMRKNRDEYVSRPRFLAITEFAPRAILYHEGNRYRIERVLNKLSEDGAEPASGEAKHCTECGYFHPARNGVHCDLCENCGKELPIAMQSLFRLQNVGTRRLDRITSAEEERQRQGFEVLTGIRFADHGAGPSRRLAEVTVNDKVVMRLTYGDTATIRRLNLGRRKRKNENLVGFNLDLERGIWAREADEDEPDSGVMPQSARIRRVVPYVEDRKNCLLIEVPGKLDAKFLHSLRAVLKSAIQIEFQLEDMELAAEPIPNREGPTRLLFYESAEGGAGVLRRLLDENESLIRVARRALALCHYDPETGVDLRRGPRSQEDCIAACYDCLMTYGNQLDHECLDRRLLPEFLLALRTAKLQASSTALSRSAQLESLKQVCDSQLEREFLEFLEASHLRLPSTAQKRIAECGTRPDFLYEEHRTAVYVDGPVHDFPDRQARDAAIEERMLDQGYTVVRFHHRNEWTQVAARYPNVFGTPSSSKAPR